MRKDYLKKHRPALWNRLILKDDLYSHLLKIDSEAQYLFDTLLPLYSERYGITEELKAIDQMEWVSQMNNIRSRASEIVNTDLIFTSRQRRQGEQNLPAAVLSLR